MVGEGARNACVGSKGSNTTIDDRAGSGYRIGDRHGVDDNIFRNFIFAPAVSLHTVGYLIGACGSVGVCHILLFTFLAVAKVPMEGSKVVACGIGGGGTGEHSGFTETYGRGFEVGNGFRIDDDIGGAGSGLSINRGDAGVDTAHLVGAVGDDGILLGGGESVGTGPAVGGTCLCVDEQVDGLAHAVRASVGGDARQNAAVGFTGARACRFGE